MSSLKLEASTMFSDKTTSITDSKSIPLLGGVKFAKIRLQRSARFDYFTPPSPFRQGHPSLSRNARAPILSMNAILDISLWVIPLPPTPDTPQEPLRPRCWKCYRECC
jgi:hypothetical protein